MVVRVAAVCVTLVPSPFRRVWCREFAPAGDLLSCAHKKVGKEGAPVPSPLAARGVPCASRGPGPRPTRFVHYVHCTQTRGAKSVDEARCARAPAPCDARLLQRGVREQPEQPTAKPDNLAVVAFRLTPFSDAEQHRALRACAQRTSTTDSAQLFERSVAERVLRGPSRTEQRREPAAQRRAARSGGAFCLLFGGPKSRSPAGAKSPHGAAIGKAPGQEIPAASEEHS